MPLNKGRLPLDNQAIRHHCMQMQGICRRQSLLAYEAYYGVVIFGVRSLEGGTVAHGSGYIEREPCMAKGTAGKGMKKVRR